MILDPGIIPVLLYRSNCIDTIIMIMKMTSFLLTRILYRPACWYSYMDQTYDTACYWNFLSLARLTGRCRFCFHTVTESYETYYVFSIPPCFYSNRWVVFDLCVLSLSSQSIISQARASSLTLIFWSLRWVRDVLA